MPELVWWCPRGPRSGADVGREVLAGEGGAGGDEVGGCALENDPAAVVASAGAEVDDPVGVRHHLQAVLDDDDRRPGLDEAVEQPEELRDEASGLLDEFVEVIFALEAANASHPVTDDVLEAAKYVQSEVIPAMDAVREVADRLERIVPDSLWPLPKYSEILFIK